ncbi:glycosyltransferase family 2 protein [Paenibacillus sp. IB182496]|uniref:Glycosyltransferase family 2 protein n=1 Tax=Paenibacillus sabuli TaxID=2772509 RepID=A0A927BVK2_9BACL|nr:glycosyltransferase [Paenibacillus sabuli]MBD2847633.1 glycosyltransferase family 2 protein [Paenibacillus sabuli]
MTERRLRILVGSPVCQKPQILARFLTGLARLRQQRVALDFYLIDDNEDPASSEQLQAFARAQERASILPAARQDRYVRDEHTHYWNERLVWKVAAFKDAIIARARELDYDHLLLIDSDLLLHPDAVERLADTGKAIISELFWTRWQPDAQPQPQVWLQDEYTQWEQQRGETLTAEEQGARYAEFIARLNQPGVYPVGGLGACTLISRGALQAGVSFRMIPNLSFWGEDRHFCIRAAALGLELYVDTRAPAYHIYRDSDLEGADDYLQRTEASGGADSADTAGSILRPSLIRERPTLTLSMIVRDECGRYLERALARHRRYVDQAVIIDDGSSDETARLCMEALGEVPVTLIRNTNSRFADEVRLRQQQWQATVRAGPGWMLNLDADEWFEDRFADEIRAMLLRDDVDLYCFRLYDMWSETHYREDACWQAHRSYRPFLLRHRPAFDYRWKETAQHCGRFPDNIFELPHALSELRLKHYGWARAADREAKAARYQALDPQALFGWQAQYDSILDAQPNLLPWQEEPSALF